MIAFIAWFITITILGWLVFPISYRLFKHLPDRGFGFSRILVLLLCGYLFWVLTSLNVTQNTLAGILLILGVIGSISVLLTLRNNLSQLLSWVRQNKSVIISTEILFLILFAFWTLIRATNPEVSGTEKPMELAFINAILRSAEFPPLDPWLSGYSISYYYFGYIMIAMIAKLTGTSGWVAFNLGSALWFALTGTAAYSLLLSLFVKRQRNRASDGEIRKVRLSELLLPLLGPFFILFVSNIEGFLEIIHAKGIFWKQNSEGVFESSFWSWLDIQEIVSPPSTPLLLAPNRPSGIWWWRASRVLQDYTALGQSKEIIDEFPFFSFLLADLHPHVLALPFGLLAIGFAFNFIYEVRHFSKNLPTVLRWAYRPFTGESIHFNQTRLWSWISRSEFWIIAFLSGSMAFLNTWDFPIYVALFSAVYCFNQIKTYGWSFNRLLEFFSFGVTVGITGIILFLPFYLGFSSQAGGFLPSLFFFTRGVHLWVMFLPLLAPIFLWLIHGWGKWASRKNLINGSMFALISVGLLWFISYLFGYLITALPMWGTDLLGLGKSSPLLISLANRFIDWGQLFYNLQGVTSIVDITQSIALRFSKPGAWITLSVLIIIVWSFLSSQANRPRAEQDTTGSTDMVQTDQSTERIFVLILVLIGCGLVVVPEFFYLRDQFGWRINTIFKFYYQAWVFWGIAAAYASILLWSKLRRFLLFFYGVVWTLIIGMALVYPYFGIKMRLSNLQREPLSLNGSQHIARFSSSEMEAINWLTTAQDGVVLEAVGGSYSGFARISTFTGLPTVLGWPGHESQWRGGSEEMGSREGDIRTIYQSGNWLETKILLGLYHVRYIYIGSLERSEYRVSENKFFQNLEPVFENEQIVIFEVPEIEAR